MKKIGLLLIIFVCLWGIQVSFAQDFDGWTMCKDVIFTGQEKTNIYKQGLDNVLKGSKSQKINDEIVKKLEDSILNAKTLREKCRIYKVQDFCVEEFGIGCYSATKINDKIYKLYSSEYSINQFVIDVNGNEQNLDSMKIDLPKKIVVGNIWLDNPQINFKGVYDVQNYSGGSKIYNVVTAKTIYDTILKLFEKYIVLQDHLIVSFKINNKIIYVNYKVNYPFKNKLGITYTHVFGGGYRVIGNKKNGLDHKVKKPTNISDLKKSQTLFERYFFHVYTDGYATYDDSYSDIGTSEYMNDNNYVKKVTKNMLPLFGYFPINEDFSIIYIANNKYRVFDPDGLGKPVIYVYDNKGIHNNVSIKTDGKFTLTIPDFTDGTSRDFVGNKDGSVNVGGKNYPYLWYKLAYNGYEYNKKGWFVEGKNIKKFFDEKLLKIGLNQKEINDFEEYRIGKYQSDKEYFVSFKFNDQLGKYISLNFKKKPDTLLRVMMETTQINSKNYKKNFVVANDDILPNYKRGGIYDVIERGGTMRADGNETIFWE